MQRRLGVVRGSPWSLLVAASALVLVVVAVAIGGWWAASTENRIVTYRVVGTLSSIELDLGSADVDVEGAGGGAVAVWRTERFAFGEPPTERRVVEGGVLRIVSRCRETVIGTCRTRYRIGVPDNVRLDVRSSSGTVRVASLNASTGIATGAGMIDINGFCGFRLTATSRTGDVDATTSCAPDRVELRTGSGNVHAVLPAGRYRVDAQSTEGDVRVDGLDVAEDASFGVQALSTSGDVLVEGDD
jgi:hypothetical protein